MNMHEPIKTEAVREVSDPKAVLEEVRDNGWGAWLVLDPGCHPDALAKLYALEPDAEKTLLFFDSSLEHMHELSPRGAGILRQKAVRLGMCAGQRSWVELLVSRSTGMCV